MFMTVIDITCCPLLHSRKNVCGVCCTCLLGFHEWHQSSITLRVCFVLTATDIYGHKLAANQCLLNRVHGEDKGNGKILQKFNFGCKRILFIVSSPWYVKLRTGKESNRMPLFHPTSWLRFFPTAKPFKGFF